MRAVGKVSTFLALATLSAAPRGSVGQPGGGRGGDGVPAGSDDDADNVYCEEDGSSAHYEEILSGSGSTMTRYGASDTGCPNHVNWQLNPNPAQQNPSNMSIPAYPMMFASGGTTDLSSVANAVGIMRNGVVMFSAWAKDQVVEYEDTAFYLESDSFDLCGGHSTIEGTYHYHNTAGCLQEQAAVAAGTSASEHSALLGWAYDGFPIYGQLGPDGVEMKMCGLDGADGTACLDVCSGYEALLPDVDDFTYRYYTSCGFDESFFPFTTNCFRGCCPDGVTCSEKMEACGDSPENGYTDDYTPGLATSLDEQYDTDLISGDDTDYIDSASSVDCTLYMGASSVTTTTTSSSGPDVTPAPSAPVATTAPVSPPTLTPINPPTLAPINPPTPVPINPSTPAPVSPPTPAPVTTSSPVPDPTPAPTTPAATTAPINPPTIAPISPPTPAPINPPTPAPINPPTPAPIHPLTPAPINLLTLAPINPPTPAPVTTSSPIPDPTPSPTAAAATTAPITRSSLAPALPPTPEPTPLPTAPAPTTAPSNPSTPNPVTMPVPIPDATFAPITSITSSMDPPSPAPVTVTFPMAPPTPEPTTPKVTTPSPTEAEVTPVLVATQSPVAAPASAPVTPETTPISTEPVATPAPTAVTQSVPAAPAATQAPVASQPTATNEPTSSDTEPVASNAPVTRATLSPVSEGGYAASGYESDDDSGYEYDDDSGYVEVGSLTTVNITATAYDTNPGENSGYTGCGTDGCLPALAHDGDSSDIESRWSCSKAITDDDCQCEITFTFGEPMDLMDVQVAFWRVEERTRWLKIRINGDIIGTFESYPGSIFNSFDIEETEVESVTMESVGIDVAEWTSLLEVRFLVDP